MEKKFKLLNGDCLEQLKKLPSNSIDSVVTDVPAGISFMNKKWDDDKGGRDHWIKWMSEVFEEVLRVLKPGAYGLVWTLPRTSHWTGIALEDAGFEIRDQISHLFGSGFPKSYNIGKAVDKKLGNDREEIGKNPNHRKLTTTNGMVGEPHSGDGIKTKGTSQWEGFGSGLKPSREDWWLCRKPLSEKTIVDNVLKWGVGGINIDGSRIEIKENVDFDNVIKTKIQDTEVYNLGLNNKENEHSAYNKQGRFPSHTLHDGSEEVLEEFAKAGVSKGGKGVRGIGKQKQQLYGGGKGYLSEKMITGQTIGYDDGGGTPARFFYCSKPSTKERNMGMDEFEEKRIEGRDIGQDERNVPHKKRISPQKNNHPTIKSVKLMNYLINLVTPPNGIVLDPFMGSGTTGISSLLNGNRFIGIEMEEEYIKIAEARILAYEKYRRFLK